MCVAAEVKSRKEFTMIVIKNNIDPPSEQREALNRIEYLKNKILSAQIRRNEVSKELKRYKRKLNAAQRRYDEKFGGNR